MMRRSRTQRGIVLVTVIFFIALLVSGVATFLRRATLDAVIARNRDLAARSEALARGGIQLATALLLQDRFDEQPPAGLPLDTRSDVWALIGATEISVADGGQLRLRIEDAGARINLNALLDPDGNAPPDTELFLTAFLDKVIDEMPLREEEKPYDAGELARNLIDFIDLDDLEQRGDREDDYYQLQIPPYRAPNRPLLSVDEIGLVEGFDKPLLEAIRPYVTVYPYAGGGGINPNTAPSYVLAALYHLSGTERRLADEDTVRRILEARDEGMVFCPKDQQTGECETLFTAFQLDSIYPEVKASSNVFHVSAEARYFGVRCTIEAVIDRSEATEPLILSWRVR